MRSPRAALLFSLVIGAACFDSGARWGDRPIPPPPVHECTVPEKRCYGSSLQQCEDASDGGTRWATKEACANEGKVCATKLLACAACQPNETFCQGLEVMHCHADGAGADSVEVCDQTQGRACRSGTCQNLCSVAATNRSNEGCEYWAVDLDNARISATSNAAAQQFAVVVSNAQPDVATDVHVFQDDSLPGQPSAPYEVATATISPLNLQVFKLGPREVDGSPDGEYNTGTHTALTRHAYKITSKFPVVAYQFNPLDNVNVFSNDASLLKPKEALGSTIPGLGKAYVVASWPQTIAATDDPNTNFNPADPINLRAFLTIVGTEADTTVRVHTNATVVAGGPVPETLANGIIEAKIGAFDVLNLETGDFLADFTGSIIEADRAVAVFTGGEASDAPHFTTLADRRCCADHLEDQLDPIRTAGVEFAIMHSPSRTRAVTAAGASTAIVPEPDFVRFVATRSNGATIKTSLKAPNDVIHLGSMGDFREVTVYGDFLAHSSDPIVVSQVMASQEACGVKRGLPGGDPSLLIEPPLEQFRTSYVFLTPDKYAFDFAFIVAPPDATVLFDDTDLATLGCQIAPADGLTDKQRGSKPTLVVYRCQLGFPMIDPNKQSPDNVLPGLQNDGVHRIVASKPVGAVVYGFDSFVSYAYAAGTQLEEISMPE
jgi:hypothetical protein